MSKDTSKRLEEILDQVVLDNALIAKRSSLDKYNNPQEIEKELNSIKQRALEAIKQEIRQLIPHKDPISIINPVGNTISPQSYTTGYNQAIDDICKRLEL